MGKFWDGIGEFLGKLIPEFLKQLILKWLLAREEASLDAFAANRLQKNAVNPREVSSTLLRNNMALQVIALATQTAERMKALFVVGNYGMGYLMDLTDLKLSFVVSIGRDKKLVDHVEYQGFVNHSTVHLCVYDEGQENPREEHVWGVDPTEPLALGPNTVLAQKLGIAAGQLLVDIEQYKRVQKKARKQLKALRAKANYSNVYFGPHLPF